MNNLDILIIRACKSENPIKRLTSLYNRFYLKQPEVRFDYLLSMVMTCIEYNKIPFQFMYVFSEMLPESDWKYKDMCRHERALHVNIHIIRFTERDKLVGFKSGLKWRNKYGH